MLSLIECLFYGQLDEELISFLTQGKELSILTVLLLPIHSQIYVFSYPFTYLRISWSKAVANLSPYREIADFAKKLHPIIDYSPSLLKTY